MCLHCYYDVVIWVYWTERKFMPVFNTRQNNQYIGVLETVSTQVQIMLCILQP